MSLPPRPLPATSPSTCGTRKKISSRFGRKVHIINGKKKGKIELEYYNTDDLNLLLEVLEQLPASGKEVE